MYLATIYALHRKNGIVRSVDVAEKRGYSKASVHNAMKRLEEFGYVKFYRGKITLTKSGLMKVENIEQKHKTIANALKLIGASNDIAEENACRMELVITDEAAVLLKLYIVKRTTEQRNITETEVQSRICFYLNARNENALVC